ncbi:MAG: hypothetical protein R3F43_31575 [bacterium]
MSGTASAAPWRPCASSRTTRRRRPPGGRARARPWSCTTTGRNLTRLAMRAASAAGAHPDDLGAIDRAAAAWYARGGAQYHCHYLVGLSGRVFELAPPTAWPTTRRAWARWSWPRPSRAGGASAGPPSATPSTCRAGARTTSR